ncbi:MAG: hypothetical protein AB7G12_10995 [Thermoanaerobaculia bacterium]
MSSSQKICYLCAKPIPEDELDAEHVFPRNLFNDGDRVGLITLPSHRSCNASYSKDDEYFRLCITVAAGDEPNAKKLWKGPVLRGVHRPESAKYRAMILGSIHEVEVRSEAGIILGKAPVMDQKSARILRVVSRMARGLYTYHTGDVLPADWPVSSDLVDPRARTDPFWSLFYKNVRSVGNGTVRFSTKVLKEDPREAFYWIVLYDSIDFWAFTGTKISEQLENGVKREMERREKVRAEGSEC